MFLTLNIALTACSAGGQESTAVPAATGTPTGASNKDWSEFSSRNAYPGATQKRTVTETPVEITSVEYIRGVRLSWTRSREVPTFEPDNQTLELPGDALQAVLMVVALKLPDDARLHVDWYFGQTLVYTDSLASREDGAHYFALVQREGDRLAPLPSGEYRADVLDGSQLIKSVRFEVGKK